MLGRTADNCERVCKFADVHISIIPTLLQESKIYDLKDTGGNVEFSSEITISSSFTAECAENAEASEKPSVDWNALKLCALCDLRVDKSLVF